MGSWLAGEPWVLFRCSGEKCRRHFRLSSTLHNSWAAQYVLRATKIIIMLLENTRSSYTFHRNSYLLRHLLQESILTVKVILLSNIVVLYEYKYYTRYKISGSCQLCIKLFMFSLQLKVVRSLCPLQLFHVTLYISHFSLLANNSDILSLR